MQHVARNESFQTHSLNASNAQSTAAFRWRHEEFVINWGTRRDAVRLVINNFNDRLIDLKHLFLLRFSESSRWWQTISRAQMMPTHGVGQ